MKTLQSWISRCCGVLLRYPDGRPPGRGRVQRDHRQASGRRHEEGGRGSRQGIPQGESEGFDQLQRGCQHHWRNGE